MAKSKFGRPPKFTAESFRRKAEAYIEERENGKQKGPITLLDFCAFAGIYKDYISEHDLAGTEDAGKENDFSETIKMLKTKAENSIQYNALL